MNHLHNSEKIIQDSLKDAFENALEKKYPRLRRKYHKGVGISIGTLPPEYKIFMIDTPTDRTLNKLRIENKKTQILNKLQTIETHYKDLNDFMKLKFRTMGMMIKKLHDQKEKIIV